MEEVSRSSRRLRPVVLLPARFGWKMQTPARPRLLTRQLYKPRTLVVKTTTTTRIIAVSRRWYQYPKRSRLLSPNPPRRPRRLLLPRLGVTVRDRRIPQARILSLWRVHRQIWSPSAVPLPTSSERRSRIPRSTRTTPLAPHEDTPALDCGINRPLPAISTQISLTSNILSPSRRARPARC
jgi:hypothetical protein